MWAERCREKQSESLSAWGSGPRNHLTWWDDVRPVIVWVVSLPLLSLQQNMLQLISSQVGLKRVQIFIKENISIKGLSISSLVFLFLDSIRVAVYDPQFKTMLIYLILGLVSVPHFILCLKQVVKSHLSLRLLKGITAGGWGFCAHSRVLLQ